MTAIIWRTHGRQNNVVLRVGTKPKCRSGSLQHESVPLPYRKRRMCNTSSSCRSIPAAHRSTSEYFVQETRRKLSLELHLTFQMQVQTNLPKLSLERLLKVFDVILRLSFVERELHVARWRRLCKTSIARQYSTRTCRDRIWCKCKFGAKQFRPTFIKMYTMSMSFDLPREEDA